MVAASVATATVVAMAAGAGCSSSTATATEAGAPEAASPEAASPSDAGSSTTSDANAGATYKLTWNVGLSVATGVGGDAAPGVAGPDGSIQAIPGVQVCVNGHSEIPCTSSAADGTFTLAGLPGGANLPITLVKDGYLSVLKPIQMGRTDNTNTQFPIFMTLASDSVPDAGFAIDQQSKGLVNVFVLSTAPPADAGPDSGLMFSLVPGATLSISPTSGNGPEYIDNNNLLDPTATSTIGVSAMFYNVAAGNYTLTVNAPNFDCEAINFPLSADGYPNGTPHQVAFPVLAGYVDLVGVLCSSSAMLAPTDGG
jgi:hypothetical protein